MAEVIDYQEADSGAVCSLCSQTSFTWGKLQGRYQTKFHPDGPWLTFRSTEKPIRARLCDGCGNIQLFALLAGTDQD